MFRILGERLYESSSVCAYSSAVTFDGVVGQSIADRGLLARDNLRLVTNYFGQFQ